MDQTDSAAIRANIAAKPITQTWSVEEWQERVALSGPPTDDDVSITSDGRRLDTIEKAVAFFAETDTDHQADSDHGEASDSTE